MLLPWTSPSTVECPNYWEFLSDRLHLRINTTVNVYRSWCGRVCFSSKPLLGPEALGHLQRDFDRELAEMLGGSLIFTKKRNLIPGHQLLPLLRQFNQLLYKQQQEQQIFSGYQSHTACVLHSAWGGIGWGSDLQRV